MFLFLALCLKFGTDIYSSFNETDLITDELITF
jgi:hypothetical protein